MSFPPAPSALPSADDRAPSLSDIDRSRAPAAPRPGGAGDRVVLVAIAAALVVLGFLPIADWIPGGFADPDFRLLVDEWISGSAIAAGLGLVAALAARTRPGLWRAGVAESLGRAFVARPLRFDLLLSAAALALYLVIAWFVFDGRPLLIDELAQSIQARIYARGALWEPAGAHQEFFRTLQMVQHDGKVFAQFPPGGPALMAIGVLAGATWIVGPLFGAAAAWLFASLARRIEARPAVAAAASLLFAFAPFMAFMAGSHMNHVPTLALVLLGALGVVASAQSPVPRPWWGLASGLGFGLAATIRPVDAAAFALPAGLWFLVRALRDRRRWADALAAGAGVAVPMAMMMWVNAQTTGHPLLSGYELLWGKEHNLGFHTNPWGAEHTPARGLELVSLYVLRLQRFLFESPVPSLIPAVVAFALARRMTPFDRYLVAASVLLLGGYFAYWHDGFYLGPRFIYPLLPLLVLWTARAPGLLRERLRPDRLPYRTIMYSALAAGVIALLASVPLRVRQYSVSFPIQRWDAGRAVRAAGIDSALVLVRESWEAQLVVRMWGLGVTNSEAERLYRAVDACALDNALASLEAMPAAGRPGTVQVLEPLLRDSLRVVKQELASGAFAHILPRAPYTPRCLERLRQTAGGVMPLAHLIATDPAPGVIWARDLHERDSLLLASHPRLPVYLLRPDGPGHDATPILVPLSRDSLHQAWRRGR
jgi:hypothetical protein